MFYPPQADSSEYQMSLNRYPETEDIEGLIFQAIEIEVGIMKRIFALNISSQKTVNISAMKN